VGDGLVDLAIQVVGVPAKIENWGQVLNYQVDL